ncbi:MAG: hypothetical protein ABSA63_02945 [Thermoplasmata archaeon]|jgi:hypothetical protein
MKDKARLSAIEEAGDRQGAVVRRQAVVLEDVDDRITRIEAILKIQRSRLIPENRIHAPGALRAAHHQRKLVEEGRR